MMARELGQLEVETRLTVLPCHCKVVIDLVAWPGLAVSYRGPIITCWGSCKWGWAETKSPWNSGSVTFDQMARETRRLERTTPEAELSRQWVQEGVLLYEKYYGSDKAKPAELRPNDTTGCAHDGNNLGHLRSDSADHAAPFELPAGKTKADYAKQKN